MAEQPTHQPERAIAGHCPACGAVTIVFNNHEVWPLVNCKCGWAGGTGSVVNRTRLESGGKIFDIYRPDY